MSRTRQSSRRTLRILAIVMQHGPITQSQIADRLDRMGGGTCRSNLYLDLDVLETEGFVTISRDNEKQIRYIAAAVPFPHRGGLKMFLTAHS